MDTVKMLMAAHSAERSVFARMIDLDIEVNSARRIMSYWMYLESAGCKDLVKRIASRDDNFISLLCAEAESALTSLQADSATPISSTSPMTFTLANPTFSLHEIVQDRERVSRGVSEFNDGVCSVVFEDILEERGLRGSNVEEDNDNGSGKGKGKAPKLSPSGSKLNPSEKEWVGKLVRVAGDGTSKQGAPAMAGGADGSGGSKTAATDRGENSIMRSGSGSESKLNPNATEWRPLDDGANDSRCLFITFSNGFPLSHNQIYLFFTWAFGPYVDNIYIHQPWDSVPLFGKVTFMASFVPALILNGREQVRFFAFGRTIWCKRYNRRNRNP